MKHPVAVAFVVALGATAALVGLVLAIYAPQQAPWALALAVGAFPFLWFFAWLVTNGVSWWRDATAGSSSRERDDDIRP